MTDKKRSASLDYAARQIGRSASFSGQRFSSPSEPLVRDIRRAPCKQYSAEVEIRVVIDGLRGEVDLSPAISSAFWVRQECLNASWFLSMADARIRIEEWSDPPPVKWSDSKYGFLPEEDSDAEEKIQSGRYRLKASPG